MSSLVCPGAGTQRCAFFLNKYGLKAESEDARIEFEPDALYVFEKPI